MNTDLITYYHERAKEYEKIYLKPERQDELKQATILLQNTFKDKDVLEIACGTGFWTEKIAQTATSVFATDLNRSVIEVAETKHYPKNNVTFGLKDVFSLSTDKKQEALFGGFIWSHIKLEDLDNFLHTINGSITPGGTVVLMDNNFVEGSNHPITKTDENGNTFQIRKLNNGTTHLVLKNFPTEDLLRTKLKGIATDIQFINLKYFWLLTYKIK